MNKYGVLVGSVMGLRTYLPMLLFWMKRLCRYIRENNDGINKFLPQPSGAAAVDGVLAACAVLEAIIIPIIGGGD